MSEAKIKHIALLRNGLAQLEDSKKLYKEALEETNEYLDLKVVKAEIADTEQEIAALETAYKDQITAKYLLTGDKNHPGANVKIFKVIEYDKDEAVKYMADQKFYDGLNVIDKFFKDLRPVPKFVKTTDDPRVQMDSDLSRYLGEDSE